MQFLLWKRTAHITEGLDGFPTLSLCTLIVSNWKDIDHSQSQAKPENKRRSDRWLKNLSYVFRRDHSLEAEESTVLITVWYTEPVDSLPHASALAYPSLGRSSLLHHYWNHRCSGRHLQFLTAARYDSHQISSIHLPFPHRIVRPSRWSSPGG